MKIRGTPGNPVSERKKAKKWTRRGIRKVSHMGTLEKLHEQRTLSVSGKFVWISFQMSLFVSGKLLCSPAKEFRPVRQASRRNTAGSLLNSPLEESAPAVRLSFCN